MISRSLRFVAVHVPALDPGVSRSGASLVPDPSLEVNLAPARDLPVDLASPFQRPGSLDPVPRTIRRRGIPGRVPQAPKTTLKSGRKKTVCRRRGIIGLIRTARTARRRTIKGRGRSHFPSRLRGKRAASAV